MIGPVSGRLLLRRQRPHLLRVVVQPTVSKDPLTADVVYFPSDQFIASPLTPPLQTTIIEKCRSIIFGSHPQLAESERRDATLDMKELNQTTRPE